MLSKLFGKMTYYAADHWLVVPKFKGVLATASVELLTNIFPLSLNRFNKKWNAPSEVVHPQGYAYPVFRKTTAWLVSERSLLKLRQVEVLHGQGQSVSDAARQIGGTAQTCYRWRKECGGMNCGQLKRRKEFEI